MSDALTQLMVEEASDLGDEAAVLRDDARRTRDPVEAICFTVAAQRCEDEARELEARARPH